MKFKKKLQGGFLALILASQYSANADVKIADASVMATTPLPEASAILEVHHWNKGVLIPRLWQGQINNISSPARGLMVYNLKKQCLDINIGETGATPVWKCANSAWYGIDDDLSPDNATETIYRDSTIGIGTNAPETTLDVDGSVYSDFDIHRKETYNFGNATANLYPWHRTGIIEFISTRTDSIAIPGMKWYQNETTVIEGRRATLYNGSAEAIVRLLPGGYGATATEAFFSREYDLLPGHSVDVVYINSRWHIID